MASYTRRITLYINGKEVKNDIYTIRSEMNKLINDQSRMTRGSQEYVAAGKQIRALDAILQQHRSNIRSTASGWSFNNIANTLNKYFLAVSTFVAGFGSVLYSGKKAITMFAEFDDKVADVMKTTNLAKDQVYAMNENLKKLDTRTAQEELMDLGRIAGKLNIKTQQEVEGFIKASDKIVVALKEDLGGEAEEAVRQIGKLVSVFGVKDEFGIEDSITKVGSAINELGMSSTANEGYIVEFTKRVAGVAPTAKISIQDVMGLAATLDHLGQTSEVSSTAYSQVITGMFANTAEYAKAAKMNVKDFTELMNRDANGAFLKLLEGLNNNDAGLQQLINSMGNLDMEGKRAISVIGVLANNLDELKKQQQISNAEFAKGTSLQQEFNVKNNSAQAELDKRRKVLNNLAIDLGQKLMPVLSASTSAFSYFVKAMSVLTDFALKNGGAIISLTAAIAAYTIATKLSVLWSNRLTQASLSEIIALKAKSVALGIAKGATLLFAAAKAVLTGNILRASAAMKLFNATLRTNPFGLIAAAIALVVTGLIAFINRTGEASKKSKILAEETSRLHKEKLEQLNEEKRSLNSLVNQITSLNENSALRKKLLQDLQQAYPGFLGNLNIEKVTNQELSNQLQLVNKAYKEKAKLAALSATSEAVQKQMTENEMRMLEIEETRQKLIEQKSINNQKPTGKTITNQYGQSINVKSEVNSSIDKELEKLASEYDKLAQENSLREQQLLSLDKKMASQKDNLFSDTTEYWQRKATEYKEAITLYQKEVEKASGQINGAELIPGYQEKIKEAEAQLKLAQEKLKAAKKAEKTEDTKKPTAPDPPVGDGKNKWSLNQDINFLKESFKLKEQLLNGEIATEEQFQQQLLALEIKTLSERINLRKESGADLLALQQELADKQISQLAEAKKREDNLTAEIRAGLPEIEKEKEEYRERLLALGLFGLQKSNMTALELQAYEALTATHQARMDKLDAQAMQQSLEKKQRSFENRLNELKLNNANELEAITTLEDAKKRLSEFMSNEQLSKVKTLAQAKKLLLKQNLKEEEVLQKEHLEELLKLLQNTISSGQFEGLNLGDQLLSEDEKEVLLRRIAELKAELAKLKNPGSSESNETEASGKEEDNRFKVDLLGFSTDDWETLFNNLEKGKLKLKDYIQIGGALNKVWSTYYDFLNAKDQAQLQKFEKGVNKQKELLDDKLEHGVISQKLYDTKMEALNTELDYKKAQVERKAAIRSRNLAIFEAIINTAQAVTEALTLGGPVGIIMASIIGAMGAVQLATIVKTPLPELPGKEKGGYMDVVRSQDGKHFNAQIEPKKRGWVNKPTVITGESATEYIVPGEAVNNPTVKPFLDVLEIARQEHKLPKLNMNAVMATNTFAGKSSGGYISGSTTVSDPLSKAPLSPANDNLLKLIEENTGVMRQLAAKLQNPLKAEVSLHGRTGIYEKMQEDEILKSNANL